MFKKLLCLMAAVVLVSACDTLGLNDGDGGANGSGGPNGGLGGFARTRGGFLLDVKRWLLAHESC